MHQPAIANAFLRFIFCYKLWRVNRVLSFSRRQIQWYQVMWPAMMVEITAMILLSAWTAFTDFGWKRSVIDETTGESMGQCDGGGNMVLLLLALALTLIPTLLTEIMAWKTIDVDAAFSESKWIFALILVQFQVSCEHWMYILCLSVPLFFDNACADLYRNLMLPGYISRFALSIYSSRCLQQWPIPWGEFDTLDPSNDKHWSHHSTKGVCGPFSAQGDWCHTRIIRKC